MTYLHRSHKQRESECQPSACTCVVERLVQQGSLKPEGNFFGLADSEAAKELVIVGIPWDRTSSYHRGAAQGPNSIRRATSAQLYNHFTERGDDLKSIWKVCDHGNTRRAMSLASLETSIKAAVELHDHRNARTMFLGGDHFVTYPSFCCTAEKQKRPLSLLYFDAHPDLYATFEGNRYSHATVVSRILEKKNSSSGVVCYVGIRASTAEQDERIKKLGLQELTASDVHRNGCDSVSKSIKSALSDQSVYLSIDLDCLDPAFAPGVGNPQPGGLTTRELLEILNGLNGLRIVAADIVEYAPNCDSKARATACTSAILIKEIMGVMSKAA